MAWLSEGIDNCIRMGKYMNVCKNYQKMIKDYDKGRLSLKQEEAFINHILHCDDCKEELEIYYIVSYGLDEDYNENKLSSEIKSCIESYDFKALVELKLKNSIERCNKTREWNRNMRILYCSIDLIMILMLLLCIIIRFY